MSGEGFHRGMGKVVELPLPCSRLSPELFLK